VRPRPVILLTFAYGAGLATGLARFVDPWTLIPLLIVGVTGRKTLSGFVCLAAILGNIRQTHPVGLERLGLGPLGVALFLQTRSR